MYQWFSLQFPLYYPISAVQWLTATWIISRPTTYPTSTLTNLVFSYAFSVPPDPVVIFDETGKRRASVVGPYLVGDTIHLVCDAFGGKFWRFFTLFDDFWRFFDYFIKLLGLVNWWDMYTIHLVFDAFGVMIWVSHYKSRLLEITQIILH